MGEQFLQSVERFFGIDAVRFQRSGGAAIEIGAQNIDETAGRISFPVFHQPDLGAGVFGAFHELGGGARVQAELIRDAHLALRGNGRALIPKISCLARAPAAMQKSLDRRKENFVGEQTDDNDDEHDGDDLIHRAQFAAIMQKLAQARSRSGW